MERPTPAPPKPVLPPRPQHITLPADNAVVDVDPGAELPRLYFKSPDGEKVIWTNDPKKAEDLSSKGWTLTEKPAYKPQEHLTERLRDNEALQQIRRDLLREASSGPKSLAKKPANFRPGRKTQRRGRKG